ncbi:GTP-binding protein [Bulleidia sp. zg-1006]|uniref:TIGR03943 family putative permease subunit n=1 Tax=Bulleidia sp. zg-1006 TaxID=2806552 RepID=UPI00193ACF61|nr:GTP-binding protein [Bulleidia sp. zg-1006]QRG86470.1 hypothetical protein JOS54_06370 [Bulleidia sp. zg-1006]
MSVPVYLFSGFLDSGKTTLIKDTFQDSNFMEGVAHTLLIRFEQGEVDYEEDFLKERGIDLVTLEKHDEMSAELAAFLQQDYQPNQVFIECNGMQSLEPLIAHLPNEWLIVQLLTTVDAQTFELYINAMRSVLFEQLRFSDVVICNRCREDTKAAVLRGNIKAINPRATIYYEAEFGQPATLKEGTLPFDKKAPLLDIKDDDYGLWYMDASEHPDDYEGKSIILRGKFAQELPGYKQSFIFGRQAMVCCENDTNLCGLTVTGVRIDEMNLGDWIEVEGQLTGLELDQGQKTLILKAERVQFYNPPRDEFVYFS